MKFSIEVKKSILFFIFLFAVFAFLFDKAEAAEPSQCTGSIVSGKQTGCSNSKDAEILSIQCPKEGYGAAVCSNMSSYLAALQSDCNKFKPSGINCNIITSNVFYGNEAAAMANYIEVNSPSGLGSGTAPAISTSAPAGFTCDSNGICFPDNTGLPDPAKGITQVASNILYWILGVFGMLALIAFVISGIQYILSAGSQEIIDTAKRSMKWSIVGVAVALSGLVIIYALDKIFRGTTPNF